MRHKLVYGLLLLVLISLAACGPGAYSVSRGEVTEYIMNTEVRHNGSYMVWMGADTVTTYCTLDLETYQMAQHYRENHIAVTIHYATINAGDADQGLLGRGCDVEQTGITTLRLISIAPAAFAQSTMTAEAQ